MYTQERKMTDKTRSTVRLLTAVEQDVCRKIASLDRATVGQRAKALLEINDGATRASASQQTGLTMGQIRYLLNTFRKKGLAIFPDDVLKQTPAPIKNAGKKKNTVKKVAANDKAVREVSTKEKKKKIKKDKKKNKGKKSKRKKSKEDRKKKPKK
jgi:hypothetical protein